MNIKTVVDGMYGENSYIVFDEKGNCALIDPAAADVIRAVSDAGLRPACILLTHGHFDHISEVDACAKSFDVPVYIHGDDAELLRDAFKNASAPLLGDHTLVSTTPCSVFDGAKITVGDLVFDVLHTPGHTQGCVCYFCENAVFTGDTLFANGYGRTDLYGGDYGKLVDSIHSLLPRLSGKTIYPGHGVSRKF